MTLRWDARALKDLEAIELLAKLQRRGELSALNGEWRGVRAAISVRCFYDESPKRIGREHASTDVSIKNLGAHSRQSFPLADRRTWTAHRYAQASGDGAGGGRRGGP